MGPRDRLRKVSRNYFSFIASAQLLFSHRSPHCYLCLVALALPDSALSLQSTKAAYAHTYPTPKLLTPSPAPTRWYTERDCDLFLLFIYFFTHSCQHRVKVKNITGTEFLNLEQ